jgi:hypothetical protein
VCPSDAGIDGSKFYTAQEVSILLRHKVDWVRRHFSGLEGVVHLGEQRSGRRRYDPILIPGSLLSSWILSRSTPPRGRNFFTKSRK